MKFGLSPNLYLSTGGLGGPEHVKLPASRGTLRCVQGSVHAPLRPREPQLRFPEESVTSSHFSPSCFNTIQYLYSLYLTVLYVWWSNWDLIHFNIQCTSVLQDELLGIVICFFRWFFWTLISTETETK